MKEEEEGTYLEMSLFMGYVQQYTVLTRHALYHTHYHTQRTHYAVVCSVSSHQRTVRHHSGRHDETIQGQTEGLMPAHVVCVCVCARVYRCRWGC